MRRHGARAFAVVFLFLLQARAQGAPEAGPRIQIAQCDDSLAARLPSGIKLEIDVLLRERGPTRAPPETIAVRCEGGEKARIEVTLEGASRASTIDLHALATEHRARAIGLAAAELVHAMAANAKIPEASPTPVAPQPTPRVEPNRTSADALPRRVWQSPAVLAGALAEWRGDPMALLVGGRLTFRSPLGQVVTPEISLDGSTGSIAATSAEVAMESLSVGAHLLWGTTAGSVRWEIGAGGRFGWTRLTGRPNADSTLQGDTLAAAWGGPELRTRIAYAPSSVRPALIAMHLGGGVVALPIRGLRDGNETVYAMEGAWISACAEVGLGL